MDEPMTDTESIMNDLRPIALRRKRRSSALSSPYSSSKYPQAHQQRSKPSNHDITTPSKRTNKRVRFSDPGPSLSTGLTPAIRRTSLNAPGRKMRSMSSVSPCRGGAPKIPRTPRTPRRRASLPPVFHLPGMPTAATGEIQFTPIRQVLDERVKRRLRRNGLSDEINAMEHEKYEKKREVSGLRQKIQEKDKKLEELEMEVEVGRQMRIELDENTESEEHRKMLELRREVDSLREQLRATSYVSPEGDGRHSHASIDPDQMQEDFNIADTEDTYEPFEESSPCKQSSPCQRAASHEDAQVQASFSSPHHESEIFRLEHEIEMSRRENANILSKWRNTFSSGLEGSLEVDSLDSLMEEIQKILLAARGRAEDAEAAVEMLKKEISTLGFSGHAAEDVLRILSQQFRSARLELERIRPGETPNGFDNYTLLQTLVEHLWKLYHQIQVGKSDIEQLKAQETALKGQFNAALVKLEGSAVKFNELQDRLNVRTTRLEEAHEMIAELKKENDERERNADRLQQALKGYRDEVSGLERLVMKMEEEFKEKSMAIKADLESQVGTEAEGRKAAEDLAQRQQVAIKNLEDELSAAQRSAEIFKTELQARIAEKEKAMEALQKELSQTNIQHTKVLQFKERQMGTLNVQLGNLTTALEEAKSSVKSLEKAKKSLESRVKEEISQGAKTVEAMQTEMMQSLTKLSEMKNAYLRQTKIRCVNGEIDSEEQTQRGPLTPQSVVRFVDVEVGRGKNRKSYDSGISFGILDEEDEDAYLPGPLSSSPSAAMH
ncbi:MAG: hypothetical protein M1834_006300 [Cirrosporium novae-zelandiae]|nr:MAG: hypothetical protein M1834_006300 [Cirrosporium novae-zelandiae]